MREGNKNRQLAYKRKISSTEPNKIYKNKTKKWSSDLLKFWINDWRYLWCFVFVFRVQTPAQLLTTYWPGHEIKWFTHIDFHYRFPPVSTVAFRLFLLCHWWLRQLGITLEPDKAVTQHRWEAMLYWHCHYWSLWSLARTKRSKPNAWCGKGPMSRLLSTAVIITTWQTPLLTTPKVGVQQLECHRVSNTVRVCLKNLYIQVWRRPSKHVGSDTEAFWLRPVMAITASVQRPGSGRIEDAGSDSTHPFQFRFSKESKDHTVQNRLGSDLDGLSVFGQNHLVWKQAGV